MGNIEVTSHGENIEIITLNRPQFLNAFNSEVMGELEDFLDHLKSDTRCLIVTGAGEKAFCAGADIEQMMKMDLKEGEEYSRMGNEFMNRLERLPIPIIAAVNGYALGGGCELVLSCDLRIAASNAKFALPELKIGIIPGWGGMKRLARDIGMPRAKEMVLTNRMINAQEALHYGLVNAVVEPGELLPSAIATAEKITAFSKTAVCFAKSAIFRSTQTEERNDCAYEIESFGQCFETQEQKQAMSEFISKKK